MKQTINHYKPKQITPEPIPIHNLPANSNITNFDTLEDFNEYFANHPEEFEEKITTNSLNRKFKIPGFKITRRKNAETGKMDTKLIKKVEKKETNNPEIEDLKNKYNQQEEIIEDLKNKLNLLSERFTKLIEKLVEEGVV